jgi:glycosyltransferase involved in cell wall biosynthesis
MQKKIGILVVAYNAATTLAQTLDRIPADFVQDVHEVLVGDDASQDSTHLVALGYQQMSTDLPLTIVRHPENLGYGGNQKWGYQYAV